MWLRDTVGDDCIHIADASIALRTWLGGIPADRLNARLKDDSDS
jgi:hypothetical protein